MFDIEQSIKEWRRRLSDAGMHETETLDELESHLRSDIAAMTSSGKRENEAFAAACSRLGNPEIMHCEFDKISTPGHRALKTGMVTCVSLLLLWNVSLMALPSAPGRHHFFVGYAGTGSGFYVALLAGFFAICQVCSGFFDGMTAARRVLFHRAIRLFSLAAATFLLASAVLQTILAATGPLVFGPAESYYLACSWSVGACLAAVVVIQHFKFVREEIKLLLPIGGSLIVLLNSYPEMWTRNWLFATVLAAHVIVLLAGIFQLRNPRGKLGNA